MPRTLRARFRRPVQANTLYGLRLRERSVHSCSTKAMRLQAAVDDVIGKQLTDLKGDGGVIALTPDGQLAWGFNTPGMFRVRMIEGGAVQMGIYKDEQVEL